MTTTMNIVKEWRVRAVNLEVRSTELSERKGGDWSLTSACVLARSEILHECADTLEAAILEETPLVPGQPGWLP
tara:strand:+ start:125 stop:346 length:222 start_codon:yes stop_codon:yes gene_type:complete